MRNTTIVIIIIILLIVGALAYTWSHKNPETIVTDTGENGTPVGSTESIIGCYGAGKDNDIYTLNIEENKSGAVRGTLAFKNFQKDSSSGVFNGTYQDGILLGNYTFQSEGTTSVMQVIFKRNGSNFTRGYGPVDSQGTKFTDLSAITYNSADPLSEFKSEACPSATTKIIFPLGGEHFAAGQTYTLKWTGGEDPTQIFLIDTSLLSAGTSVSISDRVYGVKNTGMYGYTFPKDLKSGTYELQIGSSTSNTFQVVGK